MTNELNKNLSQPRVILATVGEQPAAVLAPLLSPPLRAGREDKILLLATERTKTVASQIRKHLLMALPGLEHANVVVAQSGDDHFDKGGEASIISHCKGRPVFFLINGGRMQLVNSVIETLSRSTGSQLALAASRDHLLFVLNPASDISRHPVSDMGIELMLPLLGVEYDEDAKALKGRFGTRLDGILHLRQKAGFLFVAVDAELWSGPFPAKGPPPDQKRWNRKLLTQFRRHLLSRNNLTALGLEKRRILIKVPPHPTLRSRMVQAGIPYISPNYSLESWKQDIEDGMGHSIPERLSIHLEGVPAAPPNEVRGAGNWTGPSLAVAMGPEPGASLRAIWAAQPREMVVLYDGTHPGSVRAVRRLGEETSLGCARLFCVNASNRTSLDELNTIPRPDVVNLSPGDKWMKGLLSEWARKQTPVPVFQYVSQEVKPVVPLEVWIRQHIGKDFSHFNKDDQLDKVLLEIRNRPGELRWPTDLQVPKLRGFLWEWTVATLVSAAADESCFGLRLGERKGGERFSDEFDVISRMGARYIYWSAKNNTRDLLENLEEARGQSDRFLGRQNPAVLTVPQIPRETVRGFWDRSATSKIKYLELDRPGEQTYVVDGKLLRAPNRLREVLGVEPRHPQVKLTKWDSPLVNWVLAHVRYGTLVINNRSDKDEGARVLTNWMNWPDKRSQR